METFEAAEINGMVYSIERLQVYIDEMKEYYELRRTEKEFLDLGEVLDDMENSDNPWKFDESMEEALELTDEM